MFKFYRFLLLIFLLSSGFNLWALMPIEQLISSPYNVKHLSSPVESVFKNSSNVVVKQIEERRKLFDFIAFYREGDRLQRHCVRSTKPIYRSSWERVQKKRTILANLQYVALESVASALAQYAKDFEFSREQFRNMADGLVSNYCSKNTTIRSLKYLKADLISRFSSSDKFSLPTIDNNPLFARTLTRWTDSRIAKEQEFLTTVNIFKSLCSWGNDVENLRLMVPLVNDPFIMAHVFRQMLSEKMVWDHVDNSISKAKDLSTPKVACVGYICRKKKNSEFVKLLPRALGSAPLEEELHNMYCNDFKNANFQIRDQIPQIKKLIDDLSLDERKFVRTQMIALITGVPDFFLNMDNYKEGRELLRSSLDDTWNEWADRNNRKYSSDLLYEESLYVEKVDRKHFFNRKEANFKVVLDVNLGEIDRTNEMVGKISADFRLNLTKDFMKWARDQWISVDGRDKREELIRQFKMRIDDQLLLKRSRFIVPPWDGDLGRIVAIELIEQLGDYRGNYFHQSGHQTIEIPIQFRYGVFALKYIHYRFRSKDNDISSIAVSNDQKKR